ncbi:MAG: hypothetical protein ACKVP3_11095 [Hyphomicrobiaceae bacterium]
MSDATIRRQRIQGRMPRQDVAGGRHPMTSRAEYLAWQEQVEVDREVSGKRHLRFPLKPLSWLHRVEPKLDLSPVAEAALFAVRERAMFTHLSRLRAELAKSRLTEATIDRLVAIIRFTLELDPEVALQPRAIEQRSEAIRIVLDADPAVQEARAAREGGAR